MNVIELAEKRDEVMSGQNISCPLCGEKVFSPFDKLYVKYLEKCVMCSSDEEIEQAGEIIFQLIEG